MSVVRRLDEAAQAIPLRARSLTDLQLKALKPRDKAYKVSDRDGLYAYVAPSGAVSLRYDYRIGRRRETVTLGRYDATAPARVPRSLDVLEYGMGLSLAEARLLLTKAKRSLEQGVSPSRAKAEKKAAESDALTFGKWVERYFEFKGDPKSKGEQLADSTLAMRRSTYKRALEKPLGKLMLEEITPNRLAALCDDIKAQRGPAVAVHAREIVLMVYRHVQRKGIEVSNPAERVQASAIARFEPRDRALSPSELRLFLAALDQCATMPTLRLAVRFVLLTGVRKGEFIGATWDEIDFDTETWTIPSRRMKGGRAHVVYLSDQAMDILTTLRSCFSASRYLHPGRYDSDLPISDATLNRVIAMAIRGIQATAPEFLPFTVHDLRRTFSTSLNRAKFDERWIEMALAHVPRNRIAATYNVARYAAERRIMMQAWADMLDLWEKGESAKEVIVKAKQAASEVTDFELADDL
jgi:integrase